jgi:HEAT repeat protein
MDLKELAMWLDQTHSLRDEEAKVANLTLKRQDRNMMVPLLEILVSQSDSSELRCDAATWLVSFSPETSVSSLVSMLRDGEPTVRWVATGLLSDIADVRAKDPLIQVAQNDTDVNVRLNAVWALGRVGDASTISFLSKVASQDSQHNDEGRRVDNAAKEAIENIQKRVRDGAC